MNPTTRPPAGYSYVCFDCAEKAQQGRKPSDGSAFTIHTARCDKCKKRKPLGHVRDFGLDNHLVFRDLSPLD